MLAMSILAWSRRELFPACVEAVGAIDASRWGSQAQHVFPEGLWRPLKALLVRGRGSLLQQAGMAGMALRNHTASPRLCLGCERGSRDGPKPTSRSAPLYPAPSSSGAGPDDKSGPYRAQRGALQIFITINTTEQCGAAASGAQRGPPPSLQPRACGLWRGYHARCLLSTYAERLY